MSPLHVAGFWLVSKAPRLMRTARLAPPFDASRAVRLHPITMPSTGRMANDHSVVTTMARVA